MVHSDTITDIKRSIRYWWVYLVYGILLIAFSVLLFLTPVESYVGLAIAFSILIFFNGISNIFFSISNRKNLEGWGWYLAHGILEFIIGIVLIVYPDISLITLPFIVGFWLMIRSVFIMGFALELRRFLYLDWGLLFFFGAALGLLSFLIIIHPVIGGLSIVIWTGLAIMLFGITSIVFSFKLKKLKSMTFDKVDEFKKRIKTEAARFRKEVEANLEQAGEEGKKMIPDLEQKIGKFIKKVEEARKE